MPRRAYCAISAPRENSPVFLHEKLDSERYVRLNLRPLFDNEKPYRHSMQDIATEHLGEVFGERVICPGWLPPRSRDLNPRGFHLSGMPKENVYVNNA